MNLERAQEDEIIQIDMEDHTGANVGVMRANTFGSGI